jgi:hypothetical protein
LASGLIKGRFRWTLGDLAVLVNITTGIWEVDSIGFVAFSAAMPWMIQPKQLKIKKKRIPSKKIIRLNRGQRRNAMTNLLILSRSYSNADRDELNSPANIQLPFIPEWK